MIPVNVPLSNLTVGPTAAAALKKQRIAVIIKRRLVIVMLKAVGNNDRVSVPFKPLAAATYK